MKEQCASCQMIRAKKDMVFLSNGKWICFSCWNKYLKQKQKEDKK